MDSPPAIPRVRRPYPAIADSLVATFELNLKVYRARVSPAWQEARHGQRWQEGISGIEAYNAENKVEPMRRAL